MVYTKQVLLRNVCIYICTYAYRHAKTTNEKRDQVFEREQGNVNGRLGQIEEGSHKIML